MSREIEYIGDGEYIGHMPTQAQLDATMAIIRESCGLANETVYGKEVMDNTQQHVQHLVVRGQQMGLPMEQILMAVAARGIHTGMALARLGVDPTDMWDK